MEWASALAVTGNTISYVGDDAGAQAFIGSETKTVDLDGRMMLPGFVSGHDHLIAARWMNYGVSLYEAQSKEDYLKLIKEYVDAHPDETVIRGIGWNPAIYGGYPTAKELDPIISDRPAILLEFTIHDAWLNTKALEVGEITKDTPDAMPGVTFWRRDSQGNPTGTGHEFAWLGAFIKSGAWQPEKIIPESQEDLHQAAVESGMTAYLNPALVTPTLNSGMEALEDVKFVMEFISELDKKGALQLRTFVQPIYKNPSADPEEHAAAVAELARQYDTDRVRIFGIKIHPEGNWSSKTSLMLEPYLPGEVAEETEKPSPSTFGAASVDGDRMKAVVLAGNARGLDVNAHVDGSKTIRNMIDAIEASRNAGHTDARNHLSHLFWTHPDDLQRILDMDIPVNVTPNFSTDWSGQKKLALTLLGEERVQQQLTMYPRVFANGNKVSLSADIPSAPIEHIGPLFQVQAAMTIRDPSNPNSEVFPEGREGITLEQAIQGVTIFPAWQMRMENKIGTLEVGKYADLVILERNLFEVAPEDIAKVKVMATIMDGKYTYRAE
jgi:predicted amidohydrolase YtcJ